MILKHLFIITKKKINKLRQKMSDIEIQLGIQILLMLYYRESETTAAKKEEKEKEKYKAFFEGEEGVFIIEKLALI